MQYSFWEKFQAYRSVWVSWLGLFFSSMKLWTYVLVCSFPSLLNFKKRVLPQDFSCSPTGVRKNSIPRGTADQMCSWLQLFFPFSKKSLSSRAMTRGKSRKIVFSKFRGKRGREGEGREGRKVDFLWNLDGNLAVSSAWAICMLMSVPCHCRGLWALSVFGNVLFPLYRMRFSVAL